MHASLANLIQVALAAIALIGVALSLGRPRLHAATALMAITAAWMGFNLLEETAGFREAWLVTPAFRLLLPPLVYLLVRSLVFSGPALKPSDLAHTAPFLIGLTLTETHLTLVEHAARASLIIYAGSSAWLVHRFHRTLPEQRSDTARIRLNRVYGLIAVFVVTGGFDILRMDGRWLHASWPWLGSDAAYVTQLSVSLAMAAALIFLAVRREGLFEGLPAGGLDESGRPLRAEPGAQAEPDFDPALFERIKRALNDDALYTEPRLTRAELASAAGLTEREVSQGIRQAAGRNFNDYVNARRLEDVCAMLDAVAAGRSRARLLEIAFTAGFSSKSVFNAAFKRELGVTPTAWLNARRRLSGGASSEPGAPSGPVRTS